MSAQALAQKDWDFPPEMKPDPVAAARLRRVVVQSAEDDDLPPPFNPAKAGKPGAVRTAKVKTRTSPAPKARRSAVEVILVGGALADTGKTLADLKAPVRTRHMRSIDDLLAHIENHDVECAVVDQSRPTESRGLKLALLAAANRIGHLIVIAEPRSVAEAKAIHGVHEVLKAPAGDKDVASCVILHAASVTAPQAMDQTKRLAANLARRQEEARQTEAEQAEAEKPRLGEAGAASIMSRLKALQVPHASKLQEALPALAIPRQNRWMVAALAPLLAMSICFAGLVFYFITASSWSMPMTLGPDHPLVQSARHTLDGLEADRSKLQSSLTAVQDRLSAAGTDRETASQQLAVVRQTIEAERLQLSRLLKETRTHIARLDGIVSSAGQSWDMPSGVQTMHQLATVSNELAVRQIEADRLSQRAAYLDMLSRQSGPTVVRPAPGASTDLAYLAQELAASGDRIAAAETTIANAEAEVENLQGRLDSLDAQIATVNASAPGRALNNPVSVVFVPQENTVAFTQGASVLSCALLVMWCHEAGKLGQVVDAGAKANHPLFGSPISGALVEVALSDEAAIGKAILKAGPATAGH